MTRWFEMESADAELFTAAPYVFRYTMCYDAPPEQVWESLVSDASQSAWGPGVTDVTWLSPRPFGVGTTREVALAPGLTRVRERFFRWDEGRGCSFYVYQANAPVLWRFAEDYVLTPDGDGTRYSWTVAVEPKAVLALPFKAVVPVLKAAFGRMAADGRRYFAQR
jgi:hypothetical protein